MAEHGYVDVVEQSLIGLRVWHKRGSLSLIQVRPVLQEGATTTLIPARNNTIF